MLLPGIGNNRKGIEVSIHAYAELSLANAHIHAYVNHEVFDLMKTGDVFNMLNFTTAIGYNESLLNYFFPLPTFQAFYLRQGLKINVDLLDLDLKNRICNVNKALAEINQIHQKYHAILESDHVAFYDCLKVIVDNLSLNPHSDRAEKLLRIIKSSLKII